MGSFTFFVINAVISFLLLWLKPSNFFVFLSSGLSALIFQVLAYIDLGYMDPFAPIAFVVTCVLGLIIPLTLQNTLFASKS